MKADNDGRLAVVTLTSQSSAEEEGMMGKHRTTSESQTSEIYPMKPRLTRFERPTAIHLEPRRRKARAIMCIFAIFGL